MLDRSTFVEPLSIAPKFKENYLQLVGRHKDVDLFARKLSVALHVTRKIELNLHASCNLIS